MVSSCLSMLPRFLVGAGKQQPVSDVPGRFVESPYEQALEPELALELPTSLPQAYLALYEGCCALEVATGAARWLSPGATLGFTCLHRQSSKAKQVKTAQAPASSAAARRSPKDAHARTED